MNNPSQSLPTSAAKAPIFDEDENVDDSASENGSEHDTLCSAKE